MCPVLTGPSKLGPVPAARGGHLLTNAPSQLLCPHSETRAPEPSSQVCCRAPGGDNTIDESHYEPPMNLGAMLNSPPHRLLPGPLQHAPGPLQRPPAQIPFPRSQWCPRTGHPPAIPESSALTALGGGQHPPQVPLPWGRPSLQPCGRWKLSPTHLPPPGLPVLLLQPEDHWVQVPPRSPRATVPGASCPPSHANHTAGRRRIPT